MMRYLPVGAALLLLLSPSSCGPAVGGETGQQCLSRGVRQAEQHQYCAALDSFRGALFTEARHAAWNNIGVVYARQGQYARALLEYDRIPMESRNGVLQYNRGIALLRLGRHEEAEQALRDAATAFPRCPKVWNNLGLSLLGQRRYPAAEGAIRKALAIRGGSAKIWNNLGAVLDNAGRTEAAIGAYRRALQLDATYRIARRNLARLSGQVNRSFRRGAFAKHGPDR